MTNKAASRLSVASWIRRGPGRTGAAAALLAFGGTSVAAYDFEADVRPLLDASCMACHSNEALSPLNLTTLGFDLGDPAVFRAWERVYDRLERGEMPPPPMPRPDAAVVDPAMRSLGQALIEANIAARGEQRAPLRRLTRLEYQHTITDLLLIDPAEARAAEARPQHGR